MGQVGAFLHIGREDHGERPTAERVGDFGPVAEYLSLDAQRAQASRCMYCGVAFCQAGEGFGGARPSGCPLHNLIPEWNDLLYRGRMADAAARLRVTNPFPEFTGRVCPALCEAACNLGRDRGATTIKDNERAISDWEWSHLDVEKGTGVNSTSTSVAVVGSGPAGLACAWELARRGLSVTVVEKGDAPGGLLMYGIPQMKLPKWVVTRRTDQMEKSGVTFELGTDAADPEVAERLRRDFDAVVLAAGAGRARGVAAPGADLPGVVLAVDYLTAATQAVLAAEAADLAAQPDGAPNPADLPPDAPASDQVAALLAPGLSAAGKDVVVIGGGDTGTDCVATALRQGARSVRQLEFLPRPADPPADHDPATKALDGCWPQWPNVLKTDYGQQEAAALQGADPRTFAVDTRELVPGPDGAVAALRTVRLDWSAGRPEPVPGSEEELPAQLVLVATGFLGPRPDVLAAYDVAMADARPVAAVEKDGHRAVRTCDAGGAPVFACGDARNGATLVVTAIADGLACAAEVAQTVC